MKNSILSLLVLLFAIPAFAAEEKESVYDRVMRTGTIKCGYYVAPPEFGKDPNTGEFSGIGYEVAEAVAEKLALKIDWAEEVGWGVMIEGLLSSRYDAVCSSIWDRADQGRQVDFTIPYMYTPVGLFVRADDDRFNANKASINSPEVTIAVIDGENSQTVVQQDFPRAKVLSLPQLSDLSLMLESVATGKADVAITYQASFHEFERNNSGKLKQLFVNKPIRAFGNTIMIPRGEVEFKAMLDTALRELLNSGKIDEIVERNQAAPGDFYPIAKPYELVGAAKD
jgi:polar amino acid transport system substrate-binding protein